MTIEAEPVVRHWTLNLPVRLRLLWGAVGLVFGIALTLIALIWLAPQPPALHSPAPAANDITVTLDDANLAQVMADSLAQARLPFATHDVRAHILPNDIVTMSAETSLTLLPDRRLTATARLAVRGGHLSLRITSSTIGGLALPAPLVTAIENGLNNEFVTLGGLLILGSTKYVITGLTTTQGHMTLGLAKAGTISP
jgi:hypothetical protein